MSTGYQIKDVAARSGFSPATLRYYEEIGILANPDRTPAGYRVYTDATLDRLAFVARAKRLGCSLDEIVDLVTAWEGGRCGPVQDRLRAAVTDKLATARQQIVELTTLTADLQQAAAALERHRPDGPCDDRCGCVSDVDGAPIPLPVVLTVKQPADESGAPIACTLEVGEMRGRLDEWQAMLDLVARRERLNGGVRLVFTAAASTAELMRLAAAEQHCCQFFAFAITIDTRGVALEVTAPDDAFPIVTSLFGSAA